MTPKERSEKIADLELWLMENPNNENRTIIEIDLRKLKEQQQHRTFERDTYDIGNQYIYNV